MSPCPINSNTSHLTTTCIATSSYMCGQTYALSLTHPAGTTDGKDLTLSNMSLSNVIWPFKTVQRHTFQHPHTFHSNNIYRKMTYLYMLTSLCILLFKSNISWIAYSFTFYLSCLTLHVKNNSFKSYASLYTHALAHLLALGFKKIFASTITHISRNILLSVYRYGVCKKIKKYLV